MTTTPYIGAALKTYVFHPESGRWWFVSTILRESSAMVATPPRYYETFVWDLPEGPKGEQGSILWQGSGLDDHWRAVRELHLHGRVPQEDEE